MILLVSDLHLADTSRASTIRLDVFLQEIRNAIKLASMCGVKSIQLVLLGDIFEILKSKRWLVQEVRPWESNTPKHESTVASIVGGIIDINRDFFDGLNELGERRRPKVQVLYVPGNHDWPLRTNMGGTARQMLQTKVPSVPWERYFASSFLDEEHKLIAKHGHEWDPLNRYSSSGAAIGDVIVIDLLLTLPELVTKKLEIDELDPDIAFLYELDNVLPQEPKVIEQWVSRGLDRLIVKHPSAREIFQEACEKLTKNFDLLEERTKNQRIQFESFSRARLWEKALRRAVSTSVQKLGALDTAAFTPSLRDNKNILGDFAINDLHNIRKFGVKCDFVVSGHTHKPAIIPMNLGNCKDHWAPMYLNTGTWRRVHRVGATRQARGKRSCFATWEEQCLVTICNDQEQALLGLPAYQFQRLSRGVNG